MFTDRELAVIEAVRLAVWPTLTEFGVAVPAPEFGEGVVAMGGYSPFCCIASTRVALDVLKEYMIFGRALKVQTIIANKRGIEFLGEDREVVIGESLPGGTFVAGCGFKPAVNEGWINGHVVAILGEAVQDEVLLDTSSPQFSNLNHKILVEPLTLALPDEWGYRWVGAEDEDTGVTVLYRPHADLGGLYDAPDWQANNIDRSYFTDAVREKVKEILR